MRESNARNIGQSVGAHAVVYEGYGTYSRITETRSIERGQDQTKRTTVVVAAVAEQPKLRVAREGA